MKNLYNSAKRSDTFIPIDDAPSTEKKGEKKGREREKEGDHLKPNSSNLYVLWESRENPIDGQNEQPTQTRKSGGKRRKKKKWERGPMDGHEDIRQCEVKRMF